MAKKRKKCFSWMLIFSTVCIFLVAHTAQAAQQPNALTQDRQTIKDLKAQIKELKELEGASTENAIVITLKELSEKQRAKLVVREEEISRLTEQLKKTQKENMSVGVQALRAMENELEGLKDEKAKLLNQNSQLRSLLESEKAASANAKDKRLSKLTDSQWTVISEREKIVTALKEKIQNFNDTLTKIIKKNAYTVVGLKKEIAILKQDKQIESNSYKLLERKTQLSQEKIQFWKKKALLRLGSVEVVAEQAKEVKSKRNFSAGARSRKKENPADKKTSLKRIEGIEKEAALAHKKLGEIYTQQKLYKKAIAAYRKSISCDASDATQYYQLGLLYAQIKEKPKAITYFKKYLTLKPKTENKKKVEKLIKMLQ